jgi:hypothetical protein
MRPVRIAPSDGRGGEGTLLVIQIPGLGFDFLFKLPSSPRLGPAKRVQRPFSRGFGPSKRLFVDPSTVLGLSNLLLGGFSRGFDWSITV